MNNKEYYERKAFEIGQHHRKRMNEMHGVGMVEKNKTHILDAISHETKYMQYYSGRGKDGIMRKLHYNNSLKSVNKIELDHGRSNMVTSVITAADHFTTSQDDFDTHYHKSMSKELDHEEIIDEMFEHFKRGFEQKHQFVKLNENYQNDKTHYENKAFECGQTSRKYLQAQYPSKIEPNKEHILNAILSMAKYHVIPYDIEDMRRHSKDYYNSLSKMTRHSDWFTTDITQEGINFLDSQKQLDTPFHKSLLREYDKEDLLDEMFEHYKRGFNNHVNPQKVNESTETTTPNFNLEEYMKTFGKRLGTYVVSGGRISYYTNHEKESMHKDISRYAFLKTKAAALGNRKDYDPYKKDYFAIRELKDKLPNEIIPTYFFHHDITDHFSENIKKQFDKRMESPIYKEIYKEHETDDVFDELLPHFEAGYKEETTLKKHRQENERMAYRLGADLTDITTMYNHYSNNTKKDFLDHIHDLNQKDNVSSDNIKKFFEDKKTFGHDSVRNRIVSNGVSAHLITYNNILHFDRPEYHGDLSHLNKDQLYEHYKKHFDKGFILRERFEPDA